MVPKELNERQKELLRELHEMESDETLDEHHDNLFQRMKRAFKGD